MTILAPSVKPASTSAAPSLKPLDAVRRIAKEIARPQAADVDQKARFPVETVQALKEQKLLSALVPSSLGGAALSFGEVATMCEVLATGCASAAMVFAMHQIQIACIARHGMTAPGLCTYLREVVEKQYLIASVTSEVGVGGEMRTSVAAVSREGGRYAVNKDATTISYCEHADDLLLTARRAPEAPPNDQVLVLLKKGDYRVEKTGSWDTMGMRGTCSPSFKVFAQGPEEHVLSEPFADIASHTMVPVSHVLWASVWLGIASSAVSTARAFVRQQARAKPGTVPPTAVRLAESSSLLQTMRTNVHDVVSEAEELMTHGGTDALSSISFALKMNNLKVAASQLVVQIVNQALLICGIMGYKNDSPFALGRHLRDAHSAALMVGNDRILATNASLLLVLKEDLIPQLGIEQKPEFPMPGQFSIEDFHRDLVKHRLIIPVGVPGAFGRGAVFEDVLHRFDDLVTRTSKDDGAEKMAFPPILDRTVFEKSEFLDSFPQLAGTVFSFFGKEKEHLELQKRVHEGKPWGDLQGMTGVVLTPAACYPVYPSFTGVIPENGRLVDMQNWVFRHEPSPEPTRMQAFRVREFVRVGDPEMVIQWRDMWLARGLKLLTSLGLPAKPDAASDPFFGRGGRMLAANQRELKLKFEILVPVISEENPTAVCSFNCHQEHFGKIFEIKTKSGEVAHTACLGFGMERLVMALFKTHGFVPQEWPTAVRALLWP